MGILNRNGALFMATGIDNSGLYSGLRQSEARIEEFRAYAEKAGLAIGGYFGVQGLSGFIKQIVDVRSEFQNTEAMFKVFLGSAEKAKSFMKEMEGYAFNNVFEFKDLTQQAAQLLAYGTEVENVTSVIDKLSNVAAGVNQPLERFVELYNKAKSRGKLDAVDVQQWSAMGDIVSYLAEMLGKSKDETQALISTGKIGFAEMDQLLTNLTSTGGKFNGMMEEKMKTLGDSVGLLQDSLTSMFNQLGEKSEDYLRGGILLANDLVENYETIGEIILTLIATYGTYKAALVVVGMLEQANILIMRKAVLVKKAVALSNKSITSSEAVQIATKRVLTAQTLVYTKALRAQAAAMMANPAVLFTATIVGAGFAVYKLATATTIQEKAQEKLNAIMDEAKEKKGRLSDTTSSLTSIINSETKTIHDHIVAYEKLQDLYPSILKNMDMQKFKALGATEQQKLLNEAINQMELNDADAKIKKYENAIAGLSDNYRNATDEGQKFTQEVEQMAGVDGFFKFHSLDSVKAGLTDILNGLKEQRAEQQRIREEAEFLAKPETERKKILQDQLTELEFQKSSVISQIEEIRQVKGAWSELNPLFNILNGQLTDILGKIEDTRIKLTDNPEVKNKSYWEKIKKDAEDARNALDESEASGDKWVGLTRKIAQAESKLKLWSSPTQINASGESASDKARKQAQDIIDQEGKIIQLLDKQAQDRARTVEDLENQASQARISAMEEGFEKEEAQREYNNKLELLALDRQKEDYIRAYIQAEREKFDAAEELTLKKNPKYTKAIFDPTNILVDTSIFDNIRKEIENKHANYPQLLAEQEAKDWDEYLIQFGSYQEKRQAIINKYNREMDDAATQGKKDTLYEQMQSELDELDNSIKGSTQLMGQLFADASQKSVNEIQSIIDKAELLMKYIEAVKDKQGNAIVGGKEISKGDILGLGISEHTLKNLELSTQELESLRNAIQKLKGELGSKSPFLLLKNQITDAVGKMQQGGKKNIAQGITEIGAASARFAPDIAQFGKDLGNIVGDDDLGNKIAGITEAVGGLGETAAGVGQIMSGDIVGGSMAAVSGISKVVGAMEGLFGADYSRYNKMKEEYEKLNSIWDELIDKKKEYIKTSFGPEAYKVGKEAEELTKKAIENYRILGRERLNSGASSGSHSIGIRQWKRVTREDLRQAEEALGDAWKKEYGEKGRMTWLFDLSADDLSNLKEAGTFWAHLDDDVRGYLDSIIDGQERINDINTSIQEQLTQVSFDSVRDSFVDMLLDMDSSAEDFADDFTKYMQRAILNAQIADLMDDELKKWYADFADANNNKGGMSEADYSKLQNQWKDIVDKGIDMREKLKEAFDWDSTGSSSQQASKGGFETMSQDTGKALEGRFAALQMIGVSMDTKLGFMQANSAEMLLVIKGYNAVFVDMRNIALQSMAHLEDIATFTKKYLPTMASDLSEVKRNTIGLL